MSLIKRSGEYAGIISLTIGIVLTGLNVFFYPINVTKTKVETEKIRAELDAVKSNLHSMKPEFDAYFIDMESLAFNTLKDEDRKFWPGFWKFPKLQNEIFVQLQKLQTTGEEDPTIFLAARKFGMSKRNFRRTSVEVLCINQIGKRIARNVRIVAYKMDIPDKDAIDVFQNTDIFDHELIQKRISDRNYEEVTVRIGDLDTGAGVLFPMFLWHVFISQKTNTTLGMVRGVVYLPKRIIYTDDYLNKESTFDLRKILTPGLNIEGNIVIRG